MSKRLAWSPVAVALGLGLTATSAQATVFDFKITSSNGDASGQFTVSGGPSDYDVTGVTGTVGGNAITSLSSYGGADNRLFEPAPYVDRAGVAFDAGGLSYNIFTYKSGVALYAFCSSAVESVCVGSQADNAPSATLTVTSSAGSVPEPATWAMTLLGFAGIGLAGYRRTKKSAALA